MGWYKASTVARFRRLLHVMTYLYKRYNSRYEKSNTEAGGGTDIKNHKIFCIVLTYAYLCKNSCL